MNKSNVLNFYQRDAEINQTYKINKYVEIVAPEDDNFSFKIDTSVQENSDTNNYRLLVEIQETLRGLDERHKTHEENTTQEHLSIESSINELRIENEYLRMQMSEVNSPFKLKRYSLFLSAFFVLTIILSKYTGIHIIHPIASIITFFCSIIFYIMSLIMIKQDKKNA